MRPKVILLTALAGVGVFALAGRRRATAGRAGFVKCPSPLIYWNIL